MNEQQVPKIDGDSFVILDADAPKAIAPAAAAPVLYVPEEFDPHQFLSRRRHRCGDRARYLLHTIHTQTIFNNRSRGDGVRLKAAYLRRFMSKKHYRGIICDLEQGGVIEVDRQARDGQCNLFRLTTNFRTKTFRKYVPIDGYLVRALQQWRATKNEQITCQTRRHLREQLRRIRVDFDHANRLLNELPLSPEGLADCQNCLLRLHDQEWYFVADRFGRVHHNVSCLKRELRQFLRVDNEPLVEIDIANSQPLFCGLTFFIWAKNNSSFADIHSTDSLSGVLSLKEENLELLLSLRSSKTTKRNKRKRKEKRYLYDVHLLRVLIWMLSNTCTFVSREAFTNI